jgi:hypothetical protein
MSTDYILCKNEYIHSTSSFCITQTHRRILVLFGTFYMYVNHEITDVYFVKWLF